MKRLVTLFSMLLLFVFLLSGCTSKIYNSKSYQGTQLNNEQEVKNLGINSENRLIEHINYFGKNTSQLIKKYGEPDLKDNLYGGNIYYYENMYIAFGIDRDIVTSLFIYQGDLDSKIKIGMKLVEVIENLKLTNDAVQMSDEFSQYILTTYEGYECYLIFYDEILQEILIK